MNYSNLISILTGIPEISDTGYVAINISKR